MMRALAYEGLSNLLALQFWHCIVGTFNIHIHRLWRRSSCPAKSSIWHFRISLGGIAMTVFIMVWCHRTNFLRLSATRIQCLSPSLSVVTCKSLPLHHPVWGRLRCSLNFFDDRGERRILLLCSAKLVVFSCVVVLLTCAADMCGIFCTVLGSVLVYILPVSKICTVWTKFTGHHCYLHDYGDFVLKQIEAIWTPQRIVASFHVGRYCA